MRIKETPLQFLAVAHVRDPHSSGCRLATLCFSVALLLLLTIYANTKATASQPNHRLANVSVTRLDRNQSLSFQPASDRGFVLISLQNCPLLINGQTAVMKAGDHNAFPGKQRLELGASGSSALKFVLIDVVSALQSLTILKTTLAKQEVLDDASDRNETLLVALAPMRLRDVRDLNDEDETWKSGTPRIIALQKGQTAWLKQGMHRLRNIGNTPSQFVTVEW